MQLQSLGKHYAHSTCTVQLFCSPSRFQKQCLGPTVLEGTGESHPQVLLRGMPVLSLWDVGLAHRTKGHKDCLTMQCLTVNPSVELGQSAGGFAASFFLRMRDVFALHRVGTGLPATSGNCLREINPLLTLYRAASWLCSSVSVALRPPALA